MTGPPELPINAALNPLPESPVSLADGGVVPHMIIRSSPLRLGEFGSHAAKRLLQHYRREADIGQNTESAKREGDIS
jgi:hypothetical protein